MNKFLSSGLRLSYSEKTQTLEIWTPRGRMRWELSLIQTLQHLAVHLDMLHERGITTEAQARHVCDTVAKIKRVILPEMLAAVPTTDWLRVVWDLGIAQTELDELPRFRVWTLGQLRELDLLEEVNKERSVMRLEHWLAAARSSRPGTQPDPALEHAILARIEKLTHE